MPRFITKVALSIKGDRTEKGVEVELTTEEVAAFDPADLAPVSPVEEEKPAEAPKVALEDMAHAQLKAKAKEFGLSTAGSVADLRERIALAFQNAADELVDHILTEEDVTKHPAWFEPRPDGTVAQVGDTIKVPESEITRD